MSDTNDAPSRDLRSYLKIIGIGIATVVLGAIGSGLWDRIGAPLWDAFVEILINSIDSVVGTFKDSVYREAAKGLHERSADQLLAFFTALFLIAYTFAAGMIMKISSMLKETSAGQDEASRMPPPRGSSFVASRSARYLLCILVLLLWTMLTVNLSQAGYSKRTVVFVNQSLNRLAPYLTDEQEEILRAQFSAVNSARDYYVLYDRIAELLEEHGLENRGTPPI